MLRIVLGLCVVVLITLVVGSVAVAATEEDSLQGLLDPFALTTIGVAPGASSASFSSATLSAPRPPVRIPFRPALRSPFRPPLILR